MKYTFIRFPAGKAKAVTLSYDDGGKYDIRLLETIEKYNLKCTFNLVGDNVNREVGLTKEFIKENIIKKGHEVATHGYYHRAEGTLRPIEGIKDVLDCRLELEKSLGVIVRGMAYPVTGITFFTNSASYENIKSYLTDLDIVYARTLGDDNNGFYLPDDWHAWMPTAHHDNPKLMEYIDEFIKLDLSTDAFCAARDARLFYLWGHAHEFHNNNNWDRLDEICEKIANQNDVWYATNMEIYEYVNAYNSLVYSADGTIVYNPSVLDVWFDLDGTIYKVPSGQTIKI